MAIRTAGPRITEKAYGVKVMSDWFLVHDQLNNRDLSLLTTRELVEDTSTASPWQE